MLLPGLPIAADGETFDEALDEMVSALREYAEEWADHLRHAPNHEQELGPGSDHRPVVGRAAAGLAAAVTRLSRADAEGPPAVLSQ